MTKKQGNALPAGIYKVFWKRGGWTWAMLGELLTGDERIIMILPDGVCFASFMWRKIAKVERVPLAKMKGER